jgi:aspartate kinase
VWIWKEVDGVMTADPKLVPDAVRVPALSYREVMELAWFGAKVLHPMTVAPVQEAGIPIRIRSAFLPASPGTIVRADAPEAGPVKAVTSIRKLTALTIGGAAMIGTSDVVSRVFSLLAAAQLPVLMISQSPSMANVSLVMTGTSPPYRMSPSLPSWVTACGAHPVSPPACSPRWHPRTSTCS